MSKTNFVIFEKSFLVRYGLVSLLKENKDIEVSGDYDTADNFSSFIQKNEPDIVIINQDLHTEINPQTLKHLLSEYSFKIIGISNKHKTDTANIFNNYFLYKTEKSEILRIINKLISQTGDNIKKGKGKDNNKISERESAVLACVAKGLTNKEIAEELFISTHTVITHRKNIVRKLGIKTVSGLTVYAILNKIIDMSDLQQL